MTKRLLTTSLAAAICFLGTARVAHAGTVTFSFDTVTSGTSLANPTGDTLDNGIIQTYMRTMLACATCVAVSGNASVDQGYTGDGHVVGGPSGAATAPSVTLGTSDGAAFAASTNGAGDNFIKNLAPNTWFSFVFSGMTIQSVQFDYEIFPDGNCPSLSNCGWNGTSYTSLPDMTFSTNLGQVFHYYGVVPGTTGPISGQPTQPGWTESPCSDTSSTTACTGTVTTGNELAPQLIGTTALLNVGGATTLTFTDWPATIAIDNLKINFTNNPAVPEPATMLLLGTGLATVAARRRKMNRKS